MIHAAIEGGEAMERLKEEELAGLKLSMLKELEKTLKIVYEHQYRNILSKIVSNKKRFVRKRLPLDASENILRYNSLTIAVTAYLANLFDVFGESAVLSAKKAFEEHGLKWGRKLRKKLQPGDDLQDILPVVKALYIDVPGNDYLEVSESGLTWYLSGLGHSSHPGFYDSKAAWLRSLLGAIAPDFSAILHKSENDGDITITNIELRPPAN